MKAQHTPGPWIIIDDDEALTTDIGITGYDPQDDHFSGMVAWISRTNKVEEEERIANAYLIAASPYLLRELERMVEYYRHGETRPEALDKIEDSFAAIARAKGETP